jgi:hypothetical protein
MAITSFTVKSVSRGKGSSAVARAAYISREKLRDERLGRTFDYRARGGLEHAEIRLPEKMKGDAAEWLVDRKTLWNRAEEAESRRNARVAREYVIALPHELSAEKRLELARGFAQHIADRYAVAVDLAVHSAPPGGDTRNHHAHVLATTREVSRDGLGAKATAELRDSVRRARGLNVTTNELRQLRHDWAALANEKLAEAGIDARLEPRSAWERGIAHVPQQRLGPRITAIERAGGHSYVAERVRAEHAERQRLMLDHARARGAVAASESAERVSSARSTPAAERPVTVDELRKRAMEHWRSYRRSLESASAQNAPQLKDLSRDRDRDRGLELEL